MLFLVLLTLMNPAHAESDSNQVVSKWHSDFIESAESIDLQVVCIYEYGAKIISTHGTPPILKEKSGYSKVYLTYPHYQVAQTPEKRTIQGWISKHQILIRTGQNRYRSLQHEYNSSEANQACRTLFAGFKKYHELY
jgi:hypothetical protein